MRSFKFIAGIAGLLVLTACGQSEQNGQQVQQAKPYKFIEATGENVTLLTSYPATLEGKQDVSIRSKIDGYIEQIHVIEGQEVKKGQLLFTISNPQYNQDVMRLEASKAAAESEIATARLQVEKTRPLVDEKIVSAFDLQAAELKLKSAEANLAQIKAQLSNARTNVGYTKIQSPVTGVVGVIPFKVGSYISNATQEPLTTVSDISEVYASFALNEKEQLEMMRNLEGKDMAEKIKNMDAVSLILSTGEEYEEEGHIESFSGIVNTLTGSVRVKAAFPNKERVLLSGGSARIQIPTKVENRIVIPQGATVELQDKRMAFIVGEGNAVKGVPVKVRPVPGGKYFVVDEGLAVNDRVVVEGIGLLTEGTVIEPVKVDTKEVIQLADNLSK